MDWEAIERLFKDEFTSSLIDRQVNALERAAAACAGGILVSDLRGFSVALGLATRAVHEHGAPFEAASCALIRAASKVKSLVERCRTLVYIVHCQPFPAALSPPTGSRGALCQCRACRHLELHFRNTLL